MDDGAVEPIDRERWDAMTLMAEFPPLVRHPNKRVVLGIARPPGSPIGGSIDYSRWQAVERALERAARAEGRSEAELIREGIEAVAARHRASEPSIPLFASGEPDLASLVDELLAGFGER
jgi:hypothetical protein